jgi:hypothetical protein
VAESAARAGGGLFDRLQQNRPGNGGNGGTNDEN